MRYSLNDQFTWKELDSGVIILNLETSQYYTLNGSASDICKEVIDNKNETEILSVLRDEYEVAEEELKTDIKAQIDYLKEERIIKEYDQKSTINKKV